MAASKNERAIGSRIGPSPPVRGEMNSGYAAALKANNPAAGDPVYHFYRENGEVHEEVLTHDGGPRMPAHDPERRIATMAKTTHPDIAQAIRDRHGLGGTPQGGDNS